MLRPGAERIAALGGLQRFTGWNGPMLTDFGGFQVMSLSDLRKVNEALLVTFRSHIDGTKVELSPERSIEVQLLLGSDIAMQMDECVRLPAERADIERAMQLSLRWGERSLRAFEQAPAVDEVPPARLFVFPEPTLGAGGKNLPDPRAKKRKILRREAGDRSEGKEYVAQHRSRVACGSREARWRQNGGLAVLGYAQTRRLDEMLLDGAPIERRYAAHGVDDVFVKAGEEPESVFARQIRWSIGPSRVVGELVSASPS